MFPRIAKVTASGVTASFPFVLAKRPVFPKPVRPTGRRPGGPIDGADALVAQGKEQGREQKKQQEEEVIPRQDAPNQKPEHHQPHRVHLRHRPATPSTNEGIRHAGRVPRHGLALVQLSESVNKFPAYVGYLIRWLKSMCPAMRKLRIAQTLARAGLRLGATTVRQMLRETPDLKEPAEAALTDEPIVVSTGAIKAKRPNHIWHLNLTVIPTAGFWVPWQPFSKLLRWPLCWWVAVVIDQFSRRVCGFALFKKTPSSIEVCGFLDRVTKRTNTKPAHIVEFLALTWHCSPAVPIGTRASCCRDWSG